jgi:hypothetical protein
MLSKVPQLAVPNPVTQVTPAALFNRRLQCAWAQAYYQAHRAKGQSHACALRCLAQRWLKILWRMWRERRPYDENLHARNQQRHGSWVLQLKPNEA